MPTRSVLRACRSWSARAAPDAGERPAAPYAVIHAAPMFRYKQWTDAAAGASLPTRSPRAGSRVIATGGPAEAERRYLDEVWDGARVTRRDGQFVWPQLAGLLAQARVYVGPDTSVTHLAAAAGCPTVALYGPTDPRLWGPWPVGGMDAHLGGLGHHPAPRQCLAGAKRVAVHAVPA